MASCPVRAYFCGGSSVIFSTFVCRGLGSTVSSFSCISGGLKRVGLYDFVIRYGLYNCVLMAGWGWLNRIRWRRMDLTVLIWPPAAQYVEDIRGILEAQVEVLSHETVEIRPGKISQLVEELYAVDFAGPEKVARKMERLARPPHRLAVLQVRLVHPRMAVQDALNRVRCETIGDLKDDIRRRYRDRVDDYVYDVIIHSTEADYQTEPVRRVLQKYATNTE